MINIYHQSKWQTYLLRVWTEGNFSGWVKINITSNKPIVEDKKVTLARESYKS